jgi:O-antigen/teichoic acid export membrane protein
MDTMTGQPDDLIGGPAVTSGSTPTFDIRTLRLRGAHPRSIPATKRNAISRQRVMTLTIVDQAASSASNFALSFLIAHYSTAHVLGIFAVIQTTYILTQGLVRSLTSDCLLTRSDSEAVMSRYEHAGFLSAICCALVASALMLAVSAAFTSDLRLTFVTLALAFPLLACQDFARYIGISRYNPLYAVWLDVAWLVLFIAAYIVLRHQGLVSMPWVFGGWCASGAAVGLYALWNHLVVQHHGQLVSFWFKSERSIGFRFAGQSMLLNVWTYAAIYLFIGIFSLSVVGEIKLAQLAFGPVTVMTVGMATAMVALASRYFQVNVKKALRFVIFGAFGTALLMLLYTVAVFALPVADMTKLLGVAWPGARALVPLTGLGVATLAIDAILVSGIRALRAAKESLRLALAALPVVFLLAIGGGVLWGVQAALAGACIGNGLYGLAALVVLIRTAHRIHPAEDPAGSEDQVERPLGTYP